MKLVPDRIHGLGLRPHYESSELDREFDKLTSEHLRRRYGSADRAVSTDDLTTLVEQHVQELDVYANLQTLGMGVEGVTSFSPGKKPSVFISIDLSDNDRRQNRFRTTLSHELGHVHLHRYIIDLAIEEKRLNPGARIECKRETIVSAPVVDWREWQAAYACGAILMPARRFRQKSTEWLAGWRGDAASAGSALITAMTEEFQVSQQAAEVRLRILGVLPLLQSAA